MKYFLLLTLFSLSAFALRTQDYQKLKSAIYESMKENMAVHQNEGLKEIQKEIFPAYHKLLKAVAQDNEDFNTLYQELKDNNQSSGKYKAQRNVELYLITEVKDQDQYAELYETWHKARVAYENKRGALLKKANHQAGQSYSKNMKKIQDLRAPQS